MTPNAAPSHATPAPRPEAVRERAGIFGLIVSVWDEIRTDFVATVIFVAAVVIGFLHGWLKLRYPSTLMTFAFDIPIIASLALVLLTLPRGQKLFPECGVSRSIQFLLAIATIWAALPFPVPWLSAIASYRAYCLSPLLFLLGYHLFRTVKKIELVVWLVLLCGLATAAYGIFLQSEAEVRELMKNNALAEERLMGTFYATSKGESEFRRFSTFVSAAVFGVTMAACAQFAASRFFQAGCGILQRALLLVITGFCAYAVVISGSRTSLVLLLASLVLTGIIRRGKFQWLLLPAVGIGALYLGFSSTKGNATERFATLLDSETVMGRLFIVLNPSIHGLISAPLGNGVGACGYGVPGILIEQLREMRAERGIAAIDSADGDLGRIVADFGLIGIVVYGFIIYHGTRDSFRWMWTLRNSPLGVVGVPAGAWFFMSLVQLPIGSPYLGIPFGPLTWVMFGALRRMIDEYERLQKQYGEDVDMLPQFASFIQAPRMASLFGTRPAAGAAGAAPRPLAPAARLAARPRLLGSARTRVASADGKPAKRFLFPRNNAGRH